jgi:hypothetical protein
MVPLGSNLNLGIAIVSYNGTLNYGLVGDFNALYDLEDLAADFVAGVEELAEAAGVADLAPWPEYDDAPANEIKQRLAGAGEDLAERVREYELEHKHRQGVLNATERQLGRA